MLLMVALVCRSGAFSHRWIFRKSMSFCCNNSLQQTNECTVSMEKPVFYSDGNRNFHSRNCNYYILHANYRDKIVRAWIGSHTMYVKRSIFPSRNYYNFIEIHEWLISKNIRNVTFFIRVFSFSWFYPCILLNLAEWWVCTLWIYSVWKMNLDWN